MSRWSLVYAALVALAVVSLVCLAAAAATGTNILLVAPAGFIAGCVIGFASHALVDEREMAARLRRTEIRLTEAARGGRG